MSAPAPTSYDEIPYGNCAFLATHPDCLATVAFLHGLTTAPIDCCRVLELGCAEGGNLIPMAQTLPDSHFIGIDLSQKQIASGRAVVTSLGLTNITLEHRDILTVQPDFGTFDYILCHGVYSWVPLEVQDQILAICRRNLAPNGVAYVSYNTYPGWYQRGMVRDMLGIHVGPFRDLHERVRQSRAFLDFLGDHLVEADSPYAHVIRQEIDLLRPRSDTYLFHEHLEDDNQPLYFYEFAQRAAAYGLQYLAEAQPDVLATQLKPRAREVLAQLAGNPIQQQQYVDFLVGRTFRRSLLCHQEMPMSRTIDPARLTSLHLAGNIKPVSEQPDLASETAEEFRSKGGFMIRASHPWLKTALLLLGEAWPASPGFEELLAAVRGRLGQTSTSLDADREVRDFLTGALLQCYEAGLVELHRFPPQFSRTVSDRPLASPVARLQARMESAQITSLMHYSVALGPFERLLLQLLDGSRDRATLLEELVALAGKEVFTIEREGQPLRDPTLLRLALSGTLETTLQRFAQGALLVS